MPRQLDLFGERPERGARARVGPAAVSEEVIRSARALPAECRFGTSSWSFPGWVGLVYDRAATASRLAREGLAAYARHPLLRAVGIDRTFYAPIPAAAFAEYGAAVPDDFRFLVKAAGACTTPVDRASGAANPMFLDPAWAAGEVVAPCAEGLAGKAGAIVFQFPPLGGEWRRRPERLVDRLGEFLGRLPRGITYAVEPRDREIVCERYFDVLHALGVSHCFSLHPRLPPLDEQRRLAGPRAGRLIVARWMLHAGLGYEQALRRYRPFSRIVDEDPAGRESLAELCAGALGAGRPVLVTANNKAEGSAPLSICRLAESVARRLGRAR